MKSTENQAYITIGKIGSTYGVHGWLKIHAYTEYSSDIFNYMPWYLSAPNNQWDAIEVEDGRTHGNTLIAKLKGYDAPETARLLTGKMIAIARSQLPKLKEDR